MMSPATIRELSQQCARRASRAHLVPLIVEAEDVPTLAEHIRHVPNFGDYRPKGWNLTDTFFVDSSGFGQPGEPALTFEQFLEAVKPGYGYAIIEEGPFQVYIGQFEQINPRKQKVGVR